MRTLENCALPRREWIGPPSFCPSRTASIFSSRSNEKSPSRRLSGFLGSAASSNVIGQCHQGRYAKRSVHFPNVRRRFGIHRNRQRFEPSIRTAQRRDRFSLHPWSFSCYSHLPGDTSESERGSETRIGNQGTFSAGRGVNDSIRKVSQSTRRCCRSMMRSMVIAFGRGAGMNSNFATCATGADRVTDSFLAVLRCQSLDRIQRFLGPLLERSNFELVRFESERSIAGQDAPAPEF